MGNVLAALKVSALLMFIALGFSIGSGSSANLTASAGPVAPSSLAAGADPRDVHLLRLERRRLHRRRDSRIPAATCRARSRLGTVAVIVDLPVAEHAVSLRDAGRRAGAGEGQRARRGCRSPARCARGRHHGRRVDHQPCGEHQRDDVRRSARVLRDGARRVVFRCRGARAPALSARRRGDHRAGDLGQAFSCCPAAPMR